MKRFAEGQGDDGERETNSSPSLARREPACQSAFRDPTGSYGLEPTAFAGNADPRTKRPTEKARGMTLQPIAGGYVLVPTAELCAAWSLYRAKRIRLIDLRTWLACRELVARRRFAGGHKVRFTHEELHRLVGGVGGEHIRGSVRRLEAARLLHWSETAIRFGGDPDAPDAVRDQIRSMVQQFSPARKFVPVPRRLLRLLAGGSRRAVIATLLAHLARCLFIRGGEARASGFCKASWVAAVFGVAERNVKDARAHLVALGVLVSNDVPQWRMNRFGKGVSLNVGWSRGGGGEETHRTGSSPLRPSSTTGSAPPESNERLLPDHKNQKPAAGGRSGVLGKQERRTGRPALSNVVAADLTDTRRLLELFRQAVAVGRLPGSEHARLQFVAAAEHARAIGTRNPFGLFAAIVRRNLWHVITQGDEDAAARRIKALHDRGGGRGPLRPRTTDAGRASDAVSELLGRLVAKAGLPPAPVYPESEPAAVG